MAKAVTLKMEDRRILRTKRYWLTPPELMAALKEEFDFTYDPCPHPRPDGFDGLKADWGRSNWVNPPFMDSWTKWARKAVEEHRKGKTVVVAIPNYTSRGLRILWEAGAKWRMLGVVHWLAIEDGSQRDDGNNHLTLLAILEARP